MLISKGVAIECEVVNIWTEVISAFCLLWAGNLKILAEVASSRTDFDNNSRDLNISELGSLLIEVYFVSDIGAINEAIDTGVVAVESDGFDVGSDEGGD